jgi:hypothetical protein
LTATTPGEVTEAGEVPHRRADRVDRVVRAASERRVAARQAKEERAATAATLDRRPKVAMAVMPEGAGWPKEVLCTASALS